MIVINLASFYRQVPQKTDTALSALYYQARSKAYQDSIIPTFILNFYDTLLMRYLLPPQISTLATGYRLHKMSRAAFLAALATLFGISIEAPSVVQTLKDDMENPENTDRPDNSLETAWNQQIVITNRDHQGMRDLLQMNEPIFFYTDLDPSHLRGVLQTFGLDFKPVEAMNYAQLEANKLRRLYTGTDRASQANETLAIRTMIECIPGARKAITSPDEVEIRFISPVKEERDAAVKLGIKAEAIYSEAADFFAWLAMTTAQSDQSQSSAVQPQILL